MRVAKVDRQAFVFGQLLVRRDLLAVVVGPVWRISGGNAKKATVKPLSGSSAVLPSSLTSMANNDLRQTSVPTADAFACP